MKRTLFLAVALSLIVASVGPAVEERQVPMDTEGAILVITRTTADELDLFREYPRLTEAILFQAADGVFVLEIRQEEGGRIVQTRKPMSAGEVAEFRERVSRLVAERRPVSVLDQSGRFPLLLGDFLLSYGFYGWAVPVSLGIQDFTTTTGLYLLISGGGFLIPLFLTAEAPVTQAQATLSVGMAALGIGHGAALYGLLAGDALDIETMMGVPVITSIAEGVGGYFLAETLGMSGAEAALTTLTGTVGFAEGALLSLLSGSPNRTSFSRELFGASLAGSAGGLVLGKLMGDWTNVSDGDAVLVGDTTYLGATAAGCLLLMMEIQDVEPVAGVLAAGLATGVASGYLMQMDRDHDLAKMNIVSLSMVGGGLIGSGLGYLLFPDSLFETPWLLPTIGFVGSGLGFGIALAVLDPTVETATDSVSGAAPSVSFLVHPDGLLALQGTESARSRPGPLAELRIRY